VEEGKEIKQPVSQREWRRSKKANPERRERKGSNEVFCNNRKICCFAL